MKTLYAGWDIQFRSAWPYRNCGKSTRAFCQLCIAKMRKIKARRSGDETGYH